jgi:DNA invertase Pin-like site-specific DNA recombinase
MAPIFPCPTAVGYCRVSTTEQAEHGWSIDQQEEGIRAWAAAQSLDLVAVYRDSGRSGTSLTRRPGMRALVELVAQRGIGVVVAKSQDRLSRGVADFPALRKFLHRHGTDLFIMDGAMHLRAPSVTNREDASSANLMSGLASILAEQEIDTLRSRILPNLEMAVRSGRRGGRVPLGYRREPDGRIAIEPPDAALLNRCVTAILAGTGISRLVHQLAAEGVRDQAGNDITSDRIGGALTNPFCQGDLYWNLPGSSSTGEAQVHLRAHHPVLIDPVTFAALQAKLAERSRPRTPQVLPAERRRIRRRAARLPLNVDLVAALTPPARPVHGAVPPEAARCDQCGGVMYAVLQTVGGSGKRRRVPIYHCRRHKDLGAAACPQPPIPAEMVDQAVFTAVARSLREHRRRESATESESNPADAAATMAALAVAEAECARLRPTCEQLGAQAPMVLRERLVATEATVARLKSQAQRQSVTRSQPSGKMWEFLRHPKETWERLDAAGRRAVLSPLLRTVRMRDKKVVAIELIPWDVSAKGQE